VTAQGKAHSSRNARRHGQARPVTISPKSAADIEASALLLVGGAPSPGESDLARAAAIAQLELLQIDCERQRLLEGTSSNAQPHPN
jgi:hypothetical protein